MAEWAALLRPNRAGFQEVAPEEKAAGGVGTVANDGSLDGVAALLARAEKALGLTPRR